MWITVGSQDVETWNTEISHHQIIPEPNTLTHTKIITEYKARWEEYHDQPWNTITHSPSDIDKGPPPAPPGKDKEVQVRAQALVALAAPAATQVSTVTTQDVSIQTIAAGNIREWD